MRSLILTLVSGLALLSPAYAHHRSSYHHRPSYHHHHSYRHYGRRRLYNPIERDSLDGSCRTAARLGGPCGCYASELIFGRPVRDLWPAWNWAQKFPRTSPAVGMAAVRRHHVVIIAAINGDGTFTGRDSWGLTHRSLRGWVFVNPHSGNRAFAMVGGFSNRWARRPDEYNNDNHLTMASWYGGSQRTASGEWFHPSGFTAASRSLPFGTRLRVRYRGRTVVVRVNDRGPWVRGRGLDLSRSAARAIGLHGVGRVSWSRL